MLRIFSFGALLLAYSAVAFSTTLPAAADSRSATTARAADSGGVARPQVVENGAPLEIFDFPSYFTSTSTIGPDGNVYAVATNGILKVAPDGTNTLLPIHVTNNGRVQQRGHDLVYSNGYLWFSAFEGYIRMKTDGSDALYHQQSFGRARVAGPDGIYFPALPQCTPNYQTGLQTCFGAIARIGLDFKKTYFPISKPVTSTRVYAPSAAALVFGPNNTLYYEYYDPNRNLHTYPYGQLGKFKPGGVASVSSSRNLCGNPSNDGPSKFLFVRNAIYFIGASYTNSMNTYALCRVDTAGNYKQLTPNVPATDPSLTGSITADSDGNLWLGNLLGPGLYTYNVTSATIAGPYLPSSIPSANGTLLTGPDDNIRFFTADPALHQQFLNIYVRHLENLTPSAVGLSALVPATDLYVSEPLFSGPYTARSSDPAVATVSPASSIVGRFMVRRAGLGSTTISVTDAFGNTRYEPVTATP